MANNTIANIVNELYAGKKMAEMVNNYESTKPADTKINAWDAVIAPYLKENKIYGLIETLEIIKHAVAKINANVDDAENIPEYKEVLKKYVDEIIDWKIENALKAKIETDEKILEKERVKAEREAEKAAAKLAKENAKKEREEKRAAEKAEKEKIKAEKAKLKAEKAAEKENEKAAKRLAKSNIPMITALLKTNAAKVKNPTVTTETSENA